MRVSALIAAALGALALGLQVWVVLPYAERSAVHDLQHAAVYVHTEIQEVLGGVAGHLEIARTRSRDIALSVDDLEQFNSWFMPYLVNTASVSSVLLARDDGKELLLLGLPGDVWMNRVTDRVAHPGTVRRIRRDVRGTVLSDTVQASEYDTRTRPWFQGAMGLPDDQAVHWTQPYTFYTTKEPGITASLRWRDEKGRHTVLAFDVLLRDLAEEVHRIEPSANGFAAILTVDGTVVTPPRSPFFDHQRFDDVALLPVADLGIAPLTAAYEMWSRGGKVDGTDLELSTESGDWFVNVQDYRARPSGWKIVTAAPVGDFRPPLVRVFGTFVGAGTLVLGVGMYFAWRLARRFAVPLEQLAAESERIGRLDFSPGRAVSSPWTEISRLGAAQRRMRELLGAAAERDAQSSRELEARVAQRTRALEAANAELTSFGHAISHDLRAPLRAINGFSAILEEEHGATLDEDARRLLRRINDASRHMGELLDSLLVLARLSSHRPAFRVVDLSRLATDVADELAREDAARDVAVTIEPGCVAYGDPALLRVLMENLLGNAWKYTARCERAEIRFESVGTGPARVFRVVDTGVGFDMRVAGRLFEPFQRLHGADEYEGTGVGLATVHRIVELHGGRVWAEAEPGRGATFSFTLAPAP